METSPGEEHAGFAHAGQIAVVGIAAEHLQHEMLLQIAADEAKLIEAYVKLFTGEPQLPLHVHQRLVKQLELVMLAGLQVVALRQVAKLLVQQTGVM